MQKFSLDFATLHRGYVYCHGSRLWTRTASSQRRVKRGFRAPWDAPAEPETDAAVSVGADPVQASDHSGHSKVMLCVLGPSLRWDDVVSRVFYLSKSRNRRSRSGVVRLPVHATRIDPKANSLRPSGALHWIGSIADGYAIETSNRIRKSDARMFAASFKDKGIEVDGDQIGVCRRF